MPLPDDVLLTTAADYRLQPVVAGWAASVCARLNPATEENLTLHSAARFSRRSTLALMFTGWKTRTQLFYAWRFLSARRWLAVTAKTWISLFSITCAESSRGMFLLPISGDIDTALTAPVSATVVSSRSVFHYFAVKLAFSPFETSVRWLSELARCLA